MVVIEEKPQDHGGPEDSLSTTSDISISTTASEPEVNRFSKERLKNRLFVGHYQERRYVEHLKTYRDVVTVHDSELDLKKDLEVVESRLKNYYSGAVWVGCTEPTGSTSNHALWVKLHDLPFGHYWFQIKQITFTASEIRLRLQVIRPLQMSDTAIHGKEKQSSKSTISLEKSASKDVNADWTDSVPTLEECAFSLQTWKDNFKQNAFSFLATLLTLNNMKETFRFLFALAVAVFTGLVHMIRFTGDFSIKFMREASGLIRSSTPIVLGLIDFFTKMVGGMYILLAMMWRGQNTAPQFAPPYNVKPRLQIEPKYSQSDVRLKTQPAKLHYSYSTPGPGSRSGMQ